MGRTSKGVSTALSVLSGVLQITVVIIFYFLVIVGIKNGVTMAYQFSYEVFGNVSAEAAPGRNIEVVIGTTNEKKIAELLQEKGIIANEYSFLLREKLSVTKSHPIKPGVYVLNTTMNYEEILNILTNKEVEEEDSAS